MSEEEVKKYQKKNPERFLPRLVLLQKAMDSDVSKMIIRMSLIAVGSCLMLKIICIFFCKKKGRIMMLLLFHFICYAALINERHEYLFHVEVGR